METNTDFIDERILEASKSETKLGRIAALVLAKEMFGRSLTSALAHRICISCKGKALKDSFRTSPAYTEYLDDGLCQKCQDEIFAPV